MQGGGGDIAQDHTAGDVTVLVVDERETAMETASMLGDEVAYSVTTRFRVEDALAFLETTRPDCIVSAYDLPDGDGLSFYDSVRESTPDVPFILTTVRSRAEFARDALSRGVTDYFERTGEPADYALLAHRIQQAVSKGDAETDGASVNGDWSPNPPGTAGASATDEAALLDQLFEQIPVSLYIKDAEGRHRFMSEYDIDPERVLGRTDIDVYGDELGSESYADDMDVVSSGEPLYNKEEYNPENGEWTLTSKVPWYDADGDICGLIGVTRFITQKKEYEQELNRKNERLEEFANVVSHDLRNPLNVAAGNLALYRETGDDATLDNIETAHDRMLEIIDDLLALARSGSGIEKTTIVDLETAAASAWATVDTEDATLVVEETVRFEADEGRLQQLLENLFRNSVEHASTDSRDAARRDDESTTVTDADIDGEASTLTITVSAVDDPPGFVVKDDGPGIPAAVRDAVFDSGFSTREEGTGFGLAIVKTVADAHGWSVELGDPPEGAQVEFRFSPSTGIDS